MSDTQQGSPHHEGYQKLLRDFAFYLVGITTGNTSLPFNEEGELLEGYIQLMYYPEQDQARNQLVRVGSAFCSLEVETNATGKDLRRHRQQRDPTGSPRRHDQAHCPPR